MDRNPEVAAKYHCDKHMKMVLESAQLLCTAHKCFGLNAPYRQTHVNHPCAKWVRESLENYKWLQRLAFSLCQEYTKRYGRIHKCQEVIEWAGKNYPPLPPGNLTEFAQAMPEQYRDSDAVEAYRKYYVGDKSRFAKWKMGNVPEWYERK